MYDYIVGSLAKDRRDGNLREVEHAELVAEAKRAAIEREPAVGATRATASRAPEGHHWRARLSHLHVPGMHLPLHHA